MITLTKKEKELIKNHIVANHGKYLLTLSVIFLLLTSSGYIYNHFFNKKEILISKSIEIQREKLEAEKEMKDLQKKIAGFNSLAEEHNTKVKEVITEIKEFKGSGITYSNILSILGLGVFIFILLFVRSLYRKNRKVRTFAFRNNLTCQKPIKIKHYIH